ncbi:MAG TPA: hypothetical protein VI895_07720, partial [Bdellovibrionota bacterium]|nr:hypothetical protein [Bdellovibrionota bacterium]
DYKAVSDGTNDYAAQDFRLRGSFIVTQAINDYMTYIFYFRPHITGNNGDDYSSTYERYWTFTGVEFSF